MTASKEILEYLCYHPMATRQGIKAGIAYEGSDATLKREQQS